MSNVEYIGRVGGLAVALGVGFAVVTTPWVAWADDSGSSNSAGSAGTAGTGGSRQASPNRGDSAAAADPARATTAAGPRKKRDPVSKSGPEDAVETGPADGDEAVTVSTGESASARTTAPTAIRRASLTAGGPKRGSRAGSTSAKQQPVNDQIDVPNVDADTQPRLVEVNAGTDLTPQSGVVAHDASSAAPSEPSQPPRTMSAIVLSALATAGLGPLAPAGPPTPVESPLGLALLAVGTRPRGDIANVATAVGHSPSVTAKVAQAALVSSPVLENQASIAVGASPSGVVVGSDGRMFVANTGGGTVSVINTATGQRIDANPSIFSMDIKVGSSPSALALNLVGTRLYVANAGSGTVSVINSDTYKLIDTNPSAFGIQSISVGSSPSALAYGADGRLYVANRGSGTVSVIDTTTNALADIDTSAPGTNSISVGSSPSALAYGPDGRLYVANYGSNTVSVIDTGSYRVTNTITVGSQPAGMALGADGRLYVANRGSNTVSVIDTMTGITVDTNPNAVGANPISVGPSPTSVALSPDGSLAFVANANDTISVIDTSSYTVVSTASIDTDTTGGHVVAVGPNGTVYVTDAADRTVRVLTIAESTGVSEIGNVTMTGQRPGTLLVSPDGTRAVLVTAYPIGRVTLASYPDGVRGSKTRVAVIDTASGRQVGTTFTVTGTRAAGVQLSADGTRALITYSVNGAAGTRVAVLNATTGAQVGTTFTVTGGGSVEFSPDGARALIIGESAVAVLNTVTGAQVGTSLTGSWSLERWSADGSRSVLSTADATGTRVAVIDTTTGAQTGTTLTVTGNGSVQFGADGTRALITTKVTSAGGTTTRVAVFNTTTGTQIGTTLVLAGDGSMQTSADGSRALITSDVYDSASASHSTRLTVFNTTTGTQIGTTVVLTGGLLHGVQPKFSPDGTRALITTDVYDSTTTLRTSRVTMIDTSTGAPIGTTLTLTGPEPVETTWRADGMRALVTMTPTQYHSVVSPMLVAVVDTTGTQIGTTVSLAGMPTYGDRPVWSFDGTRALITTNANDTATGVTTTRVTTINTTTGTQIGATITLAAASGRTVLIPNANANRAVITAGDQVAIVNTAAGTQVGATVTIDGISSAPLFSADGSRALITTAGNLTVIDTTTGTQVGSTITVTDPGPRSIVTLLTADGAHALVTTDRRFFGDPAVPATPVAVIDLTTGTQAGTTLTLIGDTYASPAFTLDGAHALITTSHDDVTTGASTTRVTTIDTATGSRVGDTVTVAGVLSSGVGNPLGVLLSPDGTRALVGTTSSSPGLRTSQVTIIDTTTGRQIGNSVAVDGAVSGLAWSPDGTRVLVTTYITTATGVDQSIRVTVLEAF